MFTEVLGHKLILFNDFILYRQVMCDISRNLTTGKVLFSMMNTLRWFKKEVIITGVLSKIVLK